MTFTVEDLKKRYRKLTDKELLKEIEWRKGWSAKIVGANGAKMLNNDRKAMVELAKERGLM